MKIGLARVASRSSESGTVDRGTRRLWLGRARAIAYWGLWIFLVTGLVGNVLNISGYIEDPRTYHQVYRDAVLQQTVSWTELILLTVALPFQVAGWKKRRFSAVAVTVFALHVCFVIADDVFGIILICCT